MASMALVQTAISTKLSANKTAGAENISSICGSGHCNLSPKFASPSRKSDHNKNKKSRGSLAVVAAVGDVSSAGTTYLIAGAAAVALLGTAFPIFFSRKDTCPECDGAGFVRQAGSTLKANAARKDSTQIVCARCNGLGKLNQIDK